jgi:maltooligosyltrehalose trehalohydrolase
MRFGAEVEGDRAQFRLWAPKCREVVLTIEGAAQPIAMELVSGGWHQATLAGIKPGALYQFVLPDGLHIPDPASRHQPHDVHGPSELVDPGEYRWRDAEWRGRPWEECVLYELHIGAFTTEGTFRAAIERLPDLRDIGVTAIELMPVAEFPGRWNWGYDGVLPFAPDASYGRPEDLKALVEAAHALGIMVILDVVYNHFGPDGNYLPLYAPIFTEKHHTPWGAAVNYDAEGAAGVREFVVANALYWLVEYNMDGLRLDAIHAIVDESSPHILSEIAEAVHAAAPERHIHLLLENEENQASRLRRLPDGRPAEFTAQWNDDLHHVLHTAASGEDAGYYGEYLGDTELLGRALAEGFAFQGQPMRYRGHPRGEASGSLPPTAFVSFIQNHDQVGNRAFGDRITAFAPAEAVRAIAAVYLLAPEIPMLFMGEEWAADQPFPFFCDFGGELAEAVRNGRRKEFAKFPEFQNRASLAKIPDPTSQATFLSAKLRWDDRRRGRHAESRDWYRRILALRHAEIIPRLAGMNGFAGRDDVLGDLAVRVTWRMGDGSELALLANLKAASQHDVRLPAGRLLWSEGAIENGQLGPWTIAWTLAAAPRDGHAG